jgi:uncharacterized protein (TIGR02996 family)
MPDTRRAFLEAICEAPDDDAPRLVYADWLEEIGEMERAEFIRAQMELAKPPARGTRTRRLKVERRVKALWKQHGTTWPEQPGGGSQHLHHWERGFCAHYYASDIGKLLAELPRRLAEAPIQHVCLTSTTREVVARLVTLPLLARMRSLQLFAADPWKDRLDLVADDDVKLLADCPYLRRLEGLDLTHHEIGQEGLRTLAHAENLPALCDLKLFGNRLDDECVSVLASSPLAARLRKVHLSGITSAGARVLASTPALAKLRVLNLDNCDLRDAGARHLASATHFSGLTELWLHLCEIRNAGVQAVAASPHLANLEVLDLTSNWTVGHPAAVALVESPYLKKIRYLDLWRCEGLSRADEQLLRGRFRSRVNFARSY